MEIYWLFTVLVLGTFFQVHNAEKIKQKRQIFREQVLPSQGGKIPEEAFRADRLALNRLNKEGITIPDGVVIDARHVHKNPSLGGAMMPEVLKVYLTPEGRYVPPEGRYNYEHPKSVDTTYLVQNPLEEIGRGEGKFRNSHNSFNNHLISDPRHRQFGQRAKSQIFKPIPAQLVIPTRQKILQKNYYPTTWITDLYPWDIIYEPFDDYFINNIAFFNSHQIIADYEGFLNNFYERSIRNVAGSDSKKKESPKTFENVWAKVGSNSQANFKDRFFTKEIVKSQAPEYPRLKKIPETRFVCGGRRGMFADVETKCQVFHQCGISGKSSFLCAEGTIYSEVTKRCEWWNTVDCNSRPLNN